uniref:26S proteasome non-ATPase regulatory subunit 4 n=1 Tax=Rhabditophanes sp. KR3021 TaxID=114890 RepID=A0AC35UAN4_9BILA
MVLESTMICFDNSDWMRNGDYSPSRFQCEQEAAHIVLQCKIRANPENAVGLLTMAGDVNVRATMTKEDRKLFVKLHEIELEGRCKFVASVRTAHLALKHRQNKNHRMRIVVFIGSPIDVDDETQLTSLAKKLKKEKVNCDVVCFGEAAEHEVDAFTSFIDILNGKEGHSSNLVVASNGNLTEAVVSSGICRGEDGGNAGNIINTGSGFEFGVDPEDDPDLALALRVSLEEQRQKQREEAGNADGGNELMDVSSEGHADLASQDPATMTEAEQLEWALMMSMQETDPTEPKKEEEGGEKVVGEEERMEIAEEDNLMSDPDYLRELVSNLPGVDVNASEIRDSFNSTHVDNSDVQFEFMTEEEQIEWALRQSMNEPDEKKKTEKGPDGNK